MSNKKLFSSKETKVTRNEAGGKAFKLSDEAAIAQFAITGCLGDQFYTSAEEQLTTMLKLTENANPEFLAKTAIYAREKGYMKDMPALLVAILSVKDAKIFEKVFKVVIDNGKMLRNFVQIIRSGVVGRSSINGNIRRLIREWLTSKNDKYLLNASVGNDPSLADIIKMTHPRPTDPEREALYGYLIGKKVEKKNLPRIIKEYESFKESPEKNEVPDINFQLITGIDNIPDKVWIEIAKNAGWMMTRMNLNTFMRHNVFKDKEMVDLIAKKLKDENEIKKAMVFPYQLLTAYKNVDTDLPRKITDALHDATEISVANVPSFEDKEIWICVDVSGSMGSAITGSRGSATSRATCIDIAALVGVTLLRKCPNSHLILFDDSVHKVKISPRDSILTNASIISKFNGGGTDVGCAFNYINKEKGTGDLIVVVSDNESWVSNRYPNDTDANHGFKAFKSRNKEAKLINIDIQAYNTVQFKEGKDVLNIGGFSDSIWDVIHNFVYIGKENLVETIKRLEL